LNTHPTENVADPIYCPSCAARIDSPSQPKPGEVLNCPVCGTEFKYEPSQTAESAITQSDRPNAATSMRRRSTEEILLERLKHEPPQKKPIRWSSFALVFLVVLAASFGIFRVVSKPDKFQDVDSSAALQKRLFFQHIVDSLHTELASNPSNAAAHLSLADALYDEGQWAGSVKEFQIYLAGNPADADARVDYGYAIAQNSGNLNDALAEIDTALRYQPEHLNALINAGIMTAQTVTDTNHAVALARAKNYFERAKAVAEKTNPAIADRIDTLIQEINNTGQRMGK